MTYGSDPEYTITSSGRDLYGHRWFKVRKRGGRRADVLVHRMIPDGADVLEALELAVARIPELPGPDCY